MNKISEKAKVKVYWNDRPENYSRSNKNLVANKLAKKYGLDKDTIKVVYRPIKIDDNGNVIKLDGVSIENIGDVNYQRGLFKEWINREDKKVQYDRLIKLDDKVNAEIKEDIIGVTNKKWVLNWVYLDNFLSFGDNNLFELDKYNGLTVVKSSPSGNQGGKSTLIVDSIKFLLFGTTTNTSKNEQIFNRYRDKNTTTVRGLMVIDGTDEFIIERKLSRKLKTDNTWGVTNVTNYYKILPNGEEELMNDEDSIRTTKRIQDTVGSVRDFDIMSLATSKNLDSLIDMTTTENGKIFTKFIGLEILEKKEEIARSMYNEFSKKMKSNQYNIIQLKEDNQVNEENCVKLTDSLLNMENKLIIVNEAVEKLEKDKSTEYGKKHNINPKLNLTTIDSINTELKTLEDSGNKHKIELTDINTSIKGVGETTYDEYNESIEQKKLSEIKTNISLKHHQIGELKRNIIMLETSQVCQTCNRPLEGVNYSENIKQTKQEITLNEAEIVNLENNASNISTYLESVKSAKENLNKKQLLELERDRITLKLETARTKYKEAKQLKKDYEDNIQAIKMNNDIEIEISRLTSEIQVNRYKRDEIIKKIEIIKNEIININNSIAANRNIIITIESENDVERLYKVYIEMVGKKGVSKIILRSILPIINSELDRLMEGVCDFEIEVRIDDKNDVNLIMIKNGIEGPLRSSSGFERTVSGVALRTVLGIVSSLPSPDFIVFDEVLDKVSNENKPNIKPLFERIKELYNKVFIITHDPMAMDWAEKILTITKKDEISIIDETKK